MSGGCKGHSPPLGGTNSAPPNPLAGFEEPLRGGERERKGRKGGEREGNERDKTSPEMKFLVIVTALSQTIVIIYYVTGLEEFWSIILNPAPCWVYYTDLQASLVHYDSI